MRKSSISLLTLGIILLIFGVAASASAGSLPKVTGSAHWEWPEFGITGKAEANIIYIAPGEAKGHFNLIEKVQDLNLTHDLKAHAICVEFGEGYEGEPAASFVLQLDHIRGFNPLGDEVGQYIKL